MMTVAVLVLMVELMMVKKFPTHVLVPQDILDQGVNSEVHQDGLDLYLLSTRALIHEMD